MSFDRAVALARSDEWQRNVDLALGRPLPAAPDAGATMLGAYGFANPTITWLVARFPFLLELTPKQIAEGLNQPTCRESTGNGSCKRPMHLNLRKDVLWWHCPVHPERDERVRLPKARALKTPEISLRRLVKATAEGRTVDWQADGHGDFHAVIEETR